jgi:hypothetical protein
MLMRELDHYRPLITGVSVLNTASGEQLKTYSKTRTSKDHDGDVEKAKVGDLRRVEQECWW